MTMRNALLSLAAALLAVCCAAPVVRADEDAQSPKWLVDFNKAKEIAAKEDLSIMMEFTGSDWCPPCIRLYQNVLTKEVFQKNAPKHFVLLKLDNPRDKSKQSEEEIQQYKDLSKKFGIRGVPTIILLDATGKPFSKQVGYGGQDAEDWTNAMVEKAAVRKQRDKYLAQAKDAKGVERAKLLDKAIAGIDSELVVTEYRATVDEIIQLDTENEAELKSKYENLTKLSTINETLNKIHQANRGTPAEGVKEIEELIAKEKITGEPLQSALYTKAMMLFRSDRQAARKALEEAIEAAPNSARAEQARRLIANVFKDDNQD